MKGEKEREFPILISNDGGEVLSSDDKTGNAQWVLDYKVIITLSWCWRLETEMFWICVEGCDGGGVSEAGFYWVIHDLTILVGSTYSCCRKIVLWRYAMLALFWGALFLKKWKEICRQGLRRVYYLLIYFLFQEIFLDSLRASTFLDFKYMVFPPQGLENCCIVFSVCSLFACVCHCSLGFQLFSRRTGCSLVLFCTLFLLIKLRFFPLLSSYSS